jgi:hypothetical protein
MTDFEIIDVIDTLRSSPIVDEALWTLHRALESVLVLRNVPRGIDGIREGGFFSVFIDTCCRYYCHCCC